MESQPELSLIVERALTDAAEQYLRYVVFEPQPQDGNILAAESAEELHDVVWQSFRNLLVIYFDGDWDAVQQAILYLEDKVTSVDAFNRNAFLTLCEDLRPELPTSVELEADYDDFIDALEELTGDDLDDIDKEIKK